MHKPVILTVYWQSRQQCLLSFYVFRVITLPTSCITNVIIVTVITVISGNTMLLLWTLEFTSLYHKNQQFTNSYKIFEKWNFLG